MPILASLLRRAAAPALALAAGLALPGAPDAATLADAMAAALAGNPDLAAARAELRQVEEQLPQARAGWLPTATATSSLEGWRGESELGPSRRTTTGLGLTVRQNLYAGGATAAAVAQAESRLRAAEARLAGVEQTLLAETAHAYTAVWRDQAVLKLAKANLARIRRQLQATRDRFAVGEIATTDVAQAEARLAHAKAELENAKAALAGSQAAYVRITGEEPEGIAEPKPLQDGSASADEAAVLAEGHPDVTAARLEIEASRRQVDAATAATLPSLDLEGRAGYVDQPTAQTEWQRQASIGLTLTVPLYQGGGDRARIRAAKQQVLQREQEDRGTLDKAAERARSAWHRLKAARASISAYREEVRANRAALDGVEQEVTVGSRTVLDALDAQQDLFSSEVSLVGAKREAVLASHELRRAVGRLTPEGLGLPVGGPVETPTAAAGPHAARDAGASAAR